MLFLGIQTSVFSCENTLKVMLGTKTTLQIFTQSFLLTQQVLLNLQTLTEITWFIS